MVSMEDLRKIYLLENLSDEMIETMLPITELSHFEEREVIFEEGQNAENFYMLKR